MNRVEERRLHELRLDNRGLDLEDGLAAKTIRPSPTAHTSPVKRVRSSACASSLRRRPVRERCAERTGLEVQRRHPSNGLRNPGDHHEGCAPRKRTEKKAEGGHVLHAQREVACTHRELVQNPSRARRGSSRCRSCS